MSKAEKQHADYTVAWICALPLEAAAARTMLHETHPNLPQPASDQNVYTLGEISDHNIVIACLPSGVYGTVSAAVVASQLLSTFTRIEFGLLVGIGGGIPKTVDNNMWLGDIVVSKPTSGGTSGVIAYDSGKRTTDEGVLQLSAVLNRPPQVLLNVVSQLQAEALTGKSLEIREMIASTLKTHPNMAEHYAQPDRATDYLFEANYNHPSGRSHCDTCDVERLVQRSTRGHDGPYTHYGPIASGNQLIRDAISRDRLGDKYGALCLEMEAAGIVNQLPSLTIRGICDYCDSHKSKRWQGYAAMTAAAYAKILLSRLPRKVTNVSLSSRTEPAFMVQFARNSRFLGREAELAALEAMVLGEGSATSKAAISGLGGVGKTQIALELSYRLRGHETPYSIFWISSTTPETLGQGFVQIANRLGLGSSSAGAGDSKARVVRHLSVETAAPWILIFDNSDDTAIWTPSMIKESIPTSKHGFTLFTTRNHQLAVRLVGPHIVKVAEMDPPIASALLKSLLWDNSSQVDDVSALALTEHLHALPLAITQAASYINENQISIDKYRELLQSTEDTMVELLSQDFGDEWRYFETKNPITSTWLVSFNQVKSLNPQASDYLGFMSCLGHASIPLSLLPAADTEIKQQSALGVLKAYHFVTEHNGNASQVFTLHRLVRLSTRNWLREHGRLNDCVREVGRHLAAGFPRYAHKNRALWRSYLPHAQYALSYEDTRMDPLDQVSLAYKVGRVLWRDERNREALFHFQQAYQGRRDRFGPEDKETLLALEWVSKCLFMLDKWKESESLQLKLLDARQRRLGPNDAVVLKDFSQLARTYRYQGRLQEAWDLSTQVVQKMRSLYGDEHRLTLKAMLNLAGTCDQLSVDMEDLIESIRAFVDSPNSRYPDRSRAVRTVAEYYIRRGRFAEAEELLKEHLRLSPDPNFDRPEPIRRLVLVYRRQGKLREAQEVAEGALESSRISLGPENPTTAWHLLDTAAVYVDQGRLADAESLQTEAAKSLQLAHGYAHTDTLASMMSLARTKRHRGDLIGAEAILKTVIDGSSSMLGRDGIYTQKPLTELSRIYFRQHRYPEAEELQREVLNTVKRRLGEDHPITLDRMWRLAHTRYHRGYHEDAIQLMQDCNQRQAQRLGPDHANTVETAGVLRAWKGQMDLEAIEELTVSHDSLAEGDSRTSPERSLHVSSNTPLFKTDSNRSAVVHRFAHRVRGSLSKRWRRQET